MLSCRPIGVVLAAFWMISGTASAVPSPPQAPDRGHPLRAVLVRDDRPGCAPCAEWIALDGKVVPGSAAVVDRALRAAGARSLPIYIDSPGGSVPDAMAIGREIRARRLDVVVTRTDVDPCGGAGCRLPAGTPVPAHAHGIGAVCASACVLILAAGQRRDAAPWTGVGVHQMIKTETLVRLETLYRVVSRQEHGARVVVSRTLIGERPLAPIRRTMVPSRDTYRQVETYLSEMGIGAGLMPLMLATPPKDVHWMTAAEQQSTALVTDRVDGEYLCDKAERVARPGTPSAPLPVASIPESAGLVIRGPAATDKPHVSVGRVTWTLDPAPANQPRDAVLHAAVDIPDARLTLDIRVVHAPAPNHVVAPVIDLIVTQGPGSTVGRIERVGLPRVRTSGAVELAGTVLPGPRGGYEFRLSDDAQKSIVNVSLLNARSWLDFPMMIDGAAALVTIEHGEPSAALMQRALQAWGS